jgi:tetratricopeptide (TPR) repeat protein
VFLKNHGNYAAAEKLYRRALVIRERILGPEHLDTVGSINNLANLLSHTEDYEGAETLHRRALEIREKSLGLEHHDTLHSLDSLAAVLSDQSKYAAAEPYYRHVLAIRENKHKPEHPDVVRTLTDLSVILYYQGRKSIEMGEFEKASIQLNEALKLALRAKITEGIDACRLELKNLKMAIQQRAEKNCSRTKISQRPYENNTTSMRITSIIVQWFEEQEWEERPKVNEEKQTSSTGFGYQVSDDYSVKCYLDAAENQGNIKLLMYFNETKIPESKIKEATRFVNMVNVGIGIGHLVVIPDERCLRYYAGIDVENATLEPRHISNLLNAGLRTMEKRLPQLMAICFGGKSAEEAIET